MTHSCLRTKGDLQKQPAGQTPDWAGEGILGSPGVSHLQEADRVCFL